MFLLFVNFLSLILIVSLLVDIFLSHKNVQQCVGIAYLDLPAYKARHMETAHNRIPCQP